MMKRAITTSVVAGLLGTLGIAPAMAGEATLYGSVRTGIIMMNPEGDGDTTWDIGSVDAGDLEGSGTLTCHGKDDGAPVTTGKCPDGSDGSSVTVPGGGDSLFSRIGVKASHELDGGVTAGLHIEKRLDNFRTRIQKVSLSGDFGALAVGQMWTTYYNATSIDGFSFLGGAVADTGPFRANGVMYSSNLGGPFNFSAMVRDNNKDGKNGNSGQGEGMDIVELSGALNVGGTNLSVGYLDQDEGAEHIDVRVSGAFGPMNYAIGGGTKENANGTDVDRFGLHVAYAVVEGGKVYFQLEDVTDDEGTTDNSADAFLVGYAHTLAPGVQVVGEFRQLDKAAAGGDSDTGIVALRVDF